MTHKVLSLHSRLHHADKEIECDECGKLCKSEIALKVHIRQKHPLKSSADEIQYVECLYCERKFKQSYSARLRQHMCNDHASEHLKKKPYPCQVCFHTFSNKNSMDDHLSESHSNLKCYFCHKYFQITEHLEAHLRVHTGEKPYKCLLCNQRLKTIGHLIVSKTGNIIRTINYYQ